MKKSTLEKLSSDIRDHNKIEMLDSKIRLREVPQAPSEYSKHMRNSYNTMVEYLTRCECLGYVDVSLIREYAILEGRWLECEEHISQEGFISPHPTTNGDMESVYIKAGTKYREQADRVYKNIQRIVRENCLVSAREQYGMSSASEDPIGNLLKNQPSLRSENE